MGLHSGGGGGLYSEGILRSTEGGLIFGGGGGAIFGGGGGLYSEFYGIVGGKEMKLLWTVSRYLKTRQKQHNPISTSCQAHFSHFMRFLRSRKRYRILPIKLGVNFSTTPTPPPPLRKLGGGGGGGGINK